MGNRLSKTSSKEFSLFSTIFFFAVIFCLLEVSVAQAAYPTLAPNSDLVIVSPYDYAASGAANLSTYDCLTAGHKYRIRQAGTISRVRLYLATTTNLTGVYIKVWRKNASSTYDLVGTSNNIAGSLVAGAINAIDLSSPIPGVQEGDFYGYRVTGVGSFLYAKTGVSGVATYYVGSASSNAYDWESQSNINGAVVPIELYMSAPQVVFIGDSIMAGHPAHYSFLETTATTNINSTIEKQFGDLTGYTL